MNLPCYISLVRGLLCLLFLSESVALRLLAIVLAALTDFLDGFIARRYNQITPIGTLLDPLMDKLFVGALVICFWFEARLSLNEIIILFLRDGSLLLFTGYLFLTGRSKSWKIRSFIAGKMMTTFQFIALGLVALGLEIPKTLVYLLAIAGIASFFELFYLSYKNEERAAQS